VLNGNGGEMRGLLDQITLREARLPRKATVRLEGAEKLRFGGKDRRTTEGSETERNGAPFECMEGVFSVVWEQHQRDHISQLDVDGRAHSFENLRQRRTLGNQLEQLTFTRQQ